jgi:hypothetical protein
LDRHRLVYLDEKQTLFGVWTGDAAVGKDGGGDTSLPLFLVQNLKHHPSE